MVFHFFRCVNTVWWCAWITENFLLMWWMWSVIIINKKPKKETKFWYLCAFIFCSLAFFNFIISVISANCCRSPTQFWIHENVLLLLLQQTINSIKNMLHINITYEKCLARSSYLLCALQIVCFILSSFEFSQVTKQHLLSFYVWSGIETNILFPSSKSSLE